MTTTTQNVLDREQRKLKCKLTDDELRKRGDEMAEAELSIDERKETRRGINGEIAALRTKRNELAKVIDEREETRMVDCAWIADEVRPLEYLVRQDTGEQIETRTLDAQEGLPFDEATGEVLPAAAAAAAAAAADSTIDEKLGEPEVPAKQGEDPDADDPPFGVPAPRELPPDDADAPADPAPKPRRPSPLGGAAAGGADGDSADAFGDFEDVIDDLCAGHDEDEDADATITVDQGPPKRGGGRRPSARPAANTKGKARALSV
jgi:hypothetical protein